MLAIAALALYYLETYEANVNILQEGSSGEELYIVLAGKVAGGKIDVQAIKKRLLPPQIDKTLYDL